MAAMGMFSRNDLSSRAIEELYTPSLRSLQWMAFAIVTAFIAASVTFFQFYQIPSQSSLLSNGPSCSISESPDDPPPLIKSNSSLEFDEFGRLELSGLLENSPLAYVNAVPIDSYDQAIIFQLSYRNSPWEPHPDLGLIVSHNTKFIEVVPKNGRTSILLRANALAALCDGQAVSSEIICSLTLTIISNGLSNCSRPIEFTLFGVKAGQLHQDRPMSIALPGGQPTQVVVQVHHPGVHISADASCSHPVFLSAISEVEMRSSGLVGSVFASKPNVPAKQYSLHVPVGFYVVLMRCECDCSLTIVASTAPEHVRADWSWTIVARTLLLTVFIFCLIAPTTLLVFAYRPTRLTTMTGVQTSLSHATDDEESSERRRLQHMSSLVAIPTQVYSETLLLASESNASCSICLEPYRPSEIIRDLPCAHRFHRDCCDPWIIDKGQCPLCLQSIGSAVNYHHELGTRLYDETEFPVLRRWSKSL